jgi:hypothetical protein
MWTRMESFFGYETSSGHADKLMNEVDVTDLASWQSTFRMHVNNVTVTTSTCLGNTVANSHILRN